jgi:hypothetical protein
VVTGVGLVTAVGFDAVAATVAVRAGVSRIRFVPDFATPSGLEVRCGQDEALFEMLLPLAIARGYGTKTEFIADGSEHIWSC